MPRFKTLGAERLALIALAVLLVGAGIGWRQPMNVDEERFLGVALEMLQSGNWFIPHRAAEIYGDKPPLFMWTVALFSQLTGSPRIALYLPGLLSAATITWVLHDLGRRLWNRRIGVIAALLFLATYQSYSILRTGQIDSFLCLWVALGFYGMVRHLLLGPAWGWFYLACAAMGLGIISKGVGFIPALMLLPYAWAIRRHWHGVVAMPGQSWRWSLGLLWLLAGCAVWLLPLLVSIAHGGGAAEPGVPQGDFATPDRKPLCQRLGPSRAILVLLRQSHSQILAATDPRPALAGARLAPAIAEARWALSAVAWLGGAGAAFSASAAASASCISSPRCQAWCWPSHHWCHGYSNTGFNADRDGAAYSLPWPWCGLPCGLHVALSSR